MDVLGSSAPHWREKQTMLKKHLKALPSNMLHGGIRSASFNTLFIGCVDTVGGKQDSPPGGLSAITWSTEGGFG